MGKIEFVDRQIQKKLADLSKKMEDMTPVYKEIADKELSQTKLRFKKGEDPQNKQWPDPITLRREATGVRTQGFDNPWDYVIASNYKAAPPGYRFFNRGLGDKPLRDTGILFNDIGRAYGKNYAVVGTNLEYAEGLQEGRFPFLGINKRTMQNIKSVLTTYFKRLDK